MRDGIADLLEKSARRIRELERQRRGPEVSEPEPLTDFVTLPLIIGLPAGPWAEAIEEPDSTIAIPAAFVLTRYRNLPVYALRVTGDSMEGLGIYDGSLVVAVHLERYVFGDVVVARLNGEVTVKRLVANEEMEPYLLPENPRHEAIRVTADVELVGKVIGTWSVME